MIVRQQVYKELANDEIVISPFPQAQFTDIIALVGSAEVCTVIQNPENANDPVIIGAGDLVEAVSGTIVNANLPIDAVTFQNISSDFVVLIRCYDYA